MCYYISRCLPIYYYVPLYCNCLPLDFTWFYYMYVRDASPWFTMFYEILETAQGFTPIYDIHEVYMHCDVFTISHNTYHAARIFARFHNIPRGITKSHIDSQSFARVCDVVRWFTISTHFTKSHYVVRDPRDSHHVRFCGYRHHDL